MKTAYDVVVVGAGPAGSVAARRAAEAGLDVLLIEKRQEIGAPVRCAEAIGADLCKPFIALDERWIDARIERFAVFNSRGDKVVVPPAEPTLVINRKVFDLELALLAARAGAEVQAGCAAVGVLMQGKQVSGVKADWLGKPVEIRARLVVAADGTESQVARWAGLNSATPLADYYSGFEYLLTGLGGQITPDQCEYHLDQSLAPGGYLWVFPKGQDRANVGMVVTADQLPGESLRGKLDEFILRRFEGVSVVSVIAGGIPASGALKKLGCDGLVVVGDAAHQADPMTAGGINLGMIGADLAMQAAIPALQAGDVSWKRLQTYQEMWQARFGKMHAALYKIRKIIGKMEPDRLANMVHSASQLPLDQMSLGQILFAILKNDPLLLFEARTLITTGLVLK